MDFWNEKEKPFFEAALYPNDYTKSGTKVLAFLKEYLNVTLKEDLKSKRI